MTALPTLAQPAPMLQAPSCFNILSTVGPGHIALSHAGRNNLDNNDYSFAGRLPSAV